MKNNNSRTVAETVKLQQPQKPTRTTYAIFEQIIKLVPPYLIRNLSQKFKVDARRFSVKSHVCSLILGQLIKCGSLNTICDTLKVHESEFVRLQGVSIPNRNTFSHANRTRDPLFAEKLYWAVREDFCNQEPLFAPSTRQEGKLYRLKRNIFILDSTVIQLVLNSIDWAKHRRKKAAAKLHMSLNLSNLLPACAIAEEAAHHDSTRAKTLTSELKDGDICIADRAYTNAPFLNDLNLRGIFFVMREKSKTLYEVLQECETHHPNLISDQRVKLTGKDTAEAYNGELRRIRAIVLIDGKEREMVFYTNNMKWSATTVAALYKERWAIEVFFKELKQTCKLTDFIGYNENAVKWQIWIALLVHLIMRFLKFKSKWGYSFSRLVGVINTTVWVKKDVIALLYYYGTASPPLKTKLHIPQPIDTQLYLHLTF